MPSKAGFIAAAAAVVALASNLGAAKIVERIIARVNNEIVTQRQFDRDRQQLRTRLAGGQSGVHLAEIRVPPDRPAPQEVEQRTKEALSELKAGQRFLEVAKKYSDDPNSSDGGDVGFFKTGTLAPEIEEAIKKLDTGETSDSFKTKHGTMIVKVLERRKAGIPNFEDVAQQVMNRIYDQKIQSSLRQYLIRLRKESYIQLAPGFVDTGAERPSQAVLANKQ